MLFTCVAFGIPLPSIQWTLDGRDILQERTEYTVNETVLVSELILYNIVEENHGNYTCIGHNGIENFIGSIESETLLLNIQGNILYMNAFT